MIFSSDQGRPGTVAVAGAGGPVVVGGVGHAVGVAVQPRESIKGWEKERDGN